MDPINKTSITAIDGVTVLRPIAVDIYREEKFFRAVAPELGLWCDGLGHSEEEAVEDLKGVVLANRDSAEGVHVSNCSGYALAVAKTIKTYVELVAA